MGSQAEHGGRQESIKMRIILLLTVFATLGLCQSPPNTPLTEPPQDHRCAGRNFNGRRCCTPESPCGYGEGDCDGPLDGGANDGHRGCQGDLVCGSNNCKKFGTYFHEKDDCCDLPETLAIPEPLPLIPAGVPLVTMTDTEAAREISSVAPTTVSSLEPTTIPRMTAVRGPRVCLWLVVLALATLDSSNLAGDPGVTGHPAEGCISRSVEGAGRSGPGNVWASNVALASSTQKTFRSNTAESLTARTLGVSSDFLILGLIDETSHFNEFFLRISM